MNLQDIKYDLYHETINELRECQKNRGNLFLGGLVIDKILKHRNDARAIRGILWGVQWFEMACHININW